MKIITTTIEDFIKAENAEHGYDYVEAQFLLGYEPTMINGVWIWYKEDRVSVPVSNTSSVTTRNTPSCSVADSGRSVRLLVR